MSNPTIKLNHAPIRWNLDEGKMTFFDIPSATFWLNPSLFHILQPLREEVGAELYRLIVAYQASLGTEEDYNQMVTKLGDNFEQGFLAWGKAVSAAGWGHFEILSINFDNVEAVVRVKNPWELQMLQSTDEAEAWGCPFMLGKIIGIFSHALGQNCWADEKNLIFTKDYNSIEFHIYASDIQFKQKLEEMRSSRREAREARLEEVIAEQHQILAQLKRSETQYRTLFESSSDAIILLNRSGFLDCNQAALKMFGLNSQNDLKRLHPADLSPQRQPDGSDSRTLANHHITTALNQGSLQFEWLHKRADDTLFPADVWLTAMELDGEMLLQAVVRDVTLRKEKEAMLHTLSSALEQAGESIVITDRNGVIEYVNPAFEKITGYSAQEAIGQTPRILKSGKQHPSFYKQMWHTITRGAVWHGKVNDKRKDGTLYPAMLTISPIVDEHGKITHFIGLHSDMTEQDFLEKQLYQAQKMEAVGIMIGGIAHNFNNMLAGMTGNLYLAKKSASDNEELRLKLANIEELSSRSAKMIQQLLTFARKGIMHKQEISFSALLEETLSILCAEQSNHRIDLHREISSDALMVEGDTSQLSQVIMNLIHNAGDAVEHVTEPSITVRLEHYRPNHQFFDAHPNLPHSEYLHFSVEDNGCGIDEKEQEHIFEPFFTTKEPGKGTGLGLAMAYGSIQSHHGCIEFDSKRNGGTVFHVYLPITAQTADKTVETTNSSEPTESHGELILLADDEAVVRETTATILIDMGYRVLQATDGKQTLELFHSHCDEIDLAILDVVMPRGCGTELAEKIHARNPDLPVIFMTGHDKQLFIETHEEIDKANIYAKPLNFDALNRRIRQVLEH